MREECRGLVESYGQIRTERGLSRTRVVVYERKSAHVMATNPVGLQPGQGWNEESMTFPAEALSTVSLRCVECSALYPVIEAGRPGGASSGRSQGATLGGVSRYRCDCG